MLGYHPPGGRHPPRGRPPKKQTPQEADTPPKKQTPHPRSRHPPPPRSRHPPPSRSRHPPHPPRGRPPPQKQAPTYGQWAAGTHPTGMHSCYCHIFRNDFYGTFQILFPVVQHLTTHARMVRLVTEWGKHSATCARAQTDMRETTVRVCTQLFWLFFLFENQHRDISRSKVSVKGRGQQLPVIFATKPSVATIFLNHRVWVHSYTRHNFNVIMQMIFNLFFK